MPKCITENGEPKNVFLGAAEPPEGGASGLFKAVEAVIQCTCKSVTHLNPKTSDEIFDLTSFLATDETAVNTGDQNGLWKLFKKEKKEQLLKIGVGLPLPLVTFS